jgi:hypothetical protein
MNLFFVIAQLGESGFPIEQIGQPFDGWVQIEILFQPGIRVAPFAKLMVFEK